MVVIAALSGLACSDKGAKEESSDRDRKPRASRDEAPRAKPDDAPPAARAADPISRLCARDAECGCPIDDCPAFFAKVGLPDAVIECFVQQSCESLCAEDSGAPGSALHAACLGGAAAPAKTPSGGRASCRRDSDCPGNHDCCDGYCYQMGTSLWQTNCTMPSGKF